MKQVTESCQQSVTNDCLEQKKVPPVSCNLQLIPRAIFKTRASRSSWEHGETEFARLSSQPLLTNPCSKAAFPRCWTPQAFESKQEGSAEPQAKHTPCAFCKLSPVFASGPPPTTRCRAVWLPAQQSDSCLTMSLKSPFVMRVGVSSTVNLFGTIKRILLVLKINWKHTERKY